MKELLDNQGCYTSRGGTVRSIGKLMEMNDTLFAIGRDMYPVDTKPIRYELVAAINRLQAMADAEAAISGEE